MLKLNFQFVPPFSPNPLSKKVLILFRSGGKLKFICCFCRPKAKFPPQELLLKLEKEQTFGELAQETSMFVFKLGLARLECCSLMNGLVVDSNEVLPMIL